MDAVTAPAPTRRADDDTPAVTRRFDRWRRRRPGWLRLPRRPWMQYLVFFAVLAALLVLVRGDLLWTSGMQNPDEAELLAEGRSAAADLFPYSGYTTSTHLFLWPLVLGVLDLLGVPLTLVTAHLFGAFAFVMLGTTGWYLMMRRLGGLRATFLVLPTALVLLLGYGPGTSDYLSMTSESLPVVILCVAALVMLGSHEPMSTRRLVIGSLVAGLAIWAKPQSGPVAAAFVASCVLVTFLETRRSPEDSTWRAALLYVLRSGLVALVSFAVPSVVFVGTMALGGTLDDFVREPVAAMWGYAAHRDTTAGIVPPATTDRLAGVSSFASSFPYALAWALGGLLAMAYLDRLASKLLRALGVAVFAVPLLASLISLLPIYPLFPHYALFLYVGCLLASSVAARLATPGEPAARSSWVEGTYGGLATLMVVLLALPIVPDNATNLAKQAGHLVTGRGFDFHNEVPRDASALAGDCPAGSRVLSWGWASELYAYYDWTPASRYANATWLLTPGGRQPEYRSELLHELQQDPPDCIVEALGPAFFASIDPANTLRTVVPDVSPLLRSCYTKTAEQTFDGKPVTLYRRATTCPTD